MLQGGRSGKAEGTLDTEAVYRKAGGFRNKYIHRGRNPPTNLPIYPGRGHTWSAEERFWSPSIPDARETGYEGRAVSARNGL